MGSQVQVAVSGARVRADIVWGGDEVVYTERELAGLQREQLLSVVLRVVNSCKSSSFWLEASTFLLAASTAMAAWSRLA